MKWRSKTAVKRPKWKSMCPGDILEKEISTNKKAKYSQHDVILDVAEAADIALSEYSGTVIEIELEKEDGQLIYEVDIENGREEAEIRSEERRVGKECRYGWWTAE